MKTVRKVLLAVVILYVLFLTLQEGIIRVYRWVKIPGTANNLVQIDDWVFKAPQPFEDPSPKPGFLSLLLGCWLTLEFLALLSRTGIASVVGVVVIIAVLASISGPMIGSITDQGVRSAERAMAYSVGGAKDINNFRENIRNGCLPQVSDITCEGLFNDYFFDLGNQNGAPADPWASPRLFFPTYSWAVSQNPLTNETEYYLSVGLNSDTKENDFKRKKLNLVVVLDISGSMDTTIQNYYYDQYAGAGKSGKNEEKVNTKLNKLQVACMSIVGILDQLNPDDRFGLVLFDQQAYLAKPLNFVGATNLTALKKHIIELETGGSTNMEDGLNTGAGMLEEYADVNKNEYENRLIFLTDAMPNTDDDSESGLLNITKKNSLRGIHITFVGIGVDFNTQLIEALTKVRGANYYSVHSNSEFKKKLDTEFDYMVTPMVFDLCLKLESNSWKIEKVYGSPEADEATGEVMKINTLFPTPTKNEGARGGLVLLKLKKIADAGDLNLKVSYEDRNGISEVQEARVESPGQQSVFYQNSGIRKGILLARYVEVLHDWIKSDGKTTVQKSSTKDDWAFNRNGLNNWERTSTSLTVQTASKQVFEILKDHMEKEIRALNDKDLIREMRILDFLKAQT
ncbi:MAG: VWA domain-containing protein [Candidatus Ozemobacteraceae bacterium]